MTAFHLSPAIRADILREAFQRISVRLFSTSAADRQLRVAGRVELRAS